MDSTLAWIGIGLLVIIGITVIYDLFQHQHAILHNFPVIGHFRYLLEAIGPELRQYIVTSNNEERPFSRDQRRWVYASSKKQNNYFSFGSDEEFDNRNNYLIIKQSAFPLEPPKSGHENQYAIPCAKIMGKARQRRHRFRPGSVVNVSGMSFGSLSANAIAALNRGAQLGGCLHNTGEGGISPHHLKGADLVWQIGTAYFGCRDTNGKFNLNKLKNLTDQHPVKAIEIKLSQGAKPGAGGFLPAHKVTPLIAKVRGIPQNVDCISPAGHTAFGCTDSLLDFVESIAEATGLPVGIKSAVGDDSFFTELATLMTKDRSRGVDFITIDGGEGGTGAAPLVFTDHVAFPFKIAFSTVFKIFAQHDLCDDIVFAGSGKLGWPESALIAMALGADLLSLGRSSMLAIGCIQAQRCHTNHCPTGVATQNKWLMAGLNPTDKAARLANYMMILRKEILAVCYACGVDHPAFITPEHLELIDERYGRSSLRQLFNYDTSWGRPSNQDQKEIQRIMTKIL